MSDEMLAIRVEHDPFQQMVDRYSSLVAEIAGGYSMCSAEYTNDLSCRIAIQEKLDAGFIPDQATAGRLREADARLQSLLVPTTGSIHGNYPKAYFWFYGVPHNAPEVLKDAREIGLVS